MAGTDRSERPKIIVPGDDPPQIADSPELERLSARAELVVYRDRPRDFADKIERARGARGVLNSRGQVTWGKPEFSALPDLGVIATCSVGTDMVDLDSARRRGVVVSNQPGVNAPFVAEHLFGLMFAAAKQAVDQSIALKAGRWERPTNMLLQGKRLGIVGTGAIGAEMARLARALGMEVVAWTFNPSPAREQALNLRFVSLEELLETCDVVSLHVRLSDESRGLIGAPELARMKSTALLVNGARGDVVDNAALVAALQDGALFGAAIDVFSAKPVAADDPLLHCDRLTMTPHAADQTPEAVAAVNRDAVDNILAFLDGDPRVNAAS